MILVKIYTKFILQEIRDKLDISVSVKNLNILNKKLGVYSTCLLEIKGLSHALFSGCVSHGAQKR